MDKLTVTTARGAYFRQQVGKLSHRRWSKGHMEGGGGPHGCPAVPPQAPSTWPPAPGHLGSERGFDIIMLHTGQPRPLSLQPALVREVRAGQQVGRDREGLGMGSCTDGGGEESWVLTCAPPPSALIVTVGVSCPWPHPLLQALPTSPSRAVHWSPP